MPRLIQKTQLTKKTKPRLTYTPNFSLAIQTPQTDVGELSITVDPASLNFSFKSTLKRPQFVESPNILESKDFNRIKNQNVNLTDKFDDSDDPFFELDESRTKVAPYANPNNKNLFDLSLKLKSTKISKTNQNMRYNNGN